MATRGANELGGVCAGNRRRTRGDHRARRRNDAVKTAGYSVNLFSEHFRLLIVSRYA
jgi:hypothetical protein